MRENTSTIVLAVVSVFMLCLHILTMLNVVELTSLARDEGSCIRKAALQKLHHGGTGLYDAVVGNGPGFGKSVLG